MFLTQGYLGLKISESWEVSPIKEELIYVDRGIEKFLLQFKGPKNANNNRTRSLHRTKQSPH